MRRNTRAAFLCGLVLAAVRTVSGRLGHADAATTLNIYGHWVQASDQAAATILGDLLGSQDQPGDGRPDKGS